MEKYKANERSGHLIVRDYRRPRSYGYIAGL